jgi:SAM-dependent methyltransferase
MEEGEVNSDAWWSSKLQCPACHSAVVVGDGEVVGSCGHRWPIARGVPILLMDERSVFSVEEIARLRPTATERRGLRKFVPSITVNTAATKNYLELSERLRSAGFRRVLVLGAGEGGNGEGVLRDGGFDVVRSDVAIGVGTAVAFDAHDIPFQDASFDCVVMQAVLEHVADPERCVAEAGRILRDGGLVYAETPFMQQVHMGAYDFTRFTMSGHRRLFRNFEEIDSGVAVGPGSALAWSLMYFAGSFPQSRRGRKLTKVVSRCLVFWLKYFDFFLNGRIGAEDAASGTYFMGRRTSVERSDRQIVVDYTGGS